MKSVVCQMSKQMPFVQTSSESDDNDSNHNQALDIKSYNVPKEHGLLLLKQLYQKKGLNQQHFLNSNKPTEQQLHHVRNNDTYNSLVSIELFNPKGIN
jgi:hypothetical protein